MSAVAEASVRRARTRAITPSAQGRPWTFYVLLTIVLTAMIALILRVVDIRREITQ